MPASDAIARRGWRAVRAARDALVRGHSRPRPLAPGLPRGLAPGAHRPRGSGKSHNCSASSTTARASVATCSGTSTRPPRARARPVAGVPEARPAARALDRQRRGHDRRRDRRGPRAPRHRASHDAAVLPRAKRKAGVLLGTDRGTPLPMLEGEPELSLDLLNSATQAWVEEEYQRKEHSEIGETPSRGTCAGPASAARAPAPMRCGAPSARRSRANSAAATAPSPSRACASRFPPPTARSCSSASASRAGISPASTSVDPRSGDHLATLLPLDKARNAERVRRVAHARADAASPRAAVGIAPLLRALMADYAATGLPPAYLPKHDHRPTTTHRRTHEPNCSRSTD